MKITEEQLNRLIQEEIDQAIEEGWMDRLKARSKGAGSRLKGAASGLGAKAAGALGAETAAGEMAAAQAAKQAGAAGEEAKSLMRSHHKKIEKVVNGMIVDAKKLKLLADPEMKKALASAKSSVTRIGRLLDPDYVSPHAQKAAAAAAPAPGGTEPEGTAPPGESPDQQQARLANFRRLAAQENLKRKQKNES